MSKREKFLDDDTDSDELRRLVESGQLPRSSVVTADDLHMKPGQTLNARAKELGVSALTLRVWTAEWKGSGWAPDYVIKRAGHNNWLRNVWKSKDWPGLVREEVARGRARAAVLRRRAEAEAHAKAEQVEAETVKSYTERRKRTAPIVASWAERNYDAHKCRRHVLDHALTQWPNRGIGTHGEFLPL
jgi:hypothetical protein